MGGYGATRWDDHTRATTVEESLVLSLKPLRPGLNAVAGGRAARWGGTLQWSVRGDVTATIAYIIQRSSSGPIVRLVYTRKRRDGERIAHDDLVCVVATQPHYGGRRWWWICPLGANGIPCHRRVGKLYLTPGGRSFGCRHCHRLTYTSSQESRNPDHLARLLGLDRERARLLLRRWNR